MHQRLFLGKSNYRLIVLIALSIGAGASAGLPAGALVLFLRTIVFGMLHALWSSMFGIGLGIARYAHSRTMAVLAPCGGLLLGMLMHGVHNFSAVSVAQGSEFVLPMVVIMFASYTLGCIAWLVLVFIAGRGEAAWIRAELSEEVTGGLLTVDQARACGRYRSRVATRWAALREHGFGQAHQLGHLYCLGAELAFKKRQLAIHPDETKNADEIVRLREEFRQVQEALAAKTPKQSRISVNDV